MNAKKILQYLGVFGSFATIVFFYVNLFSWSFGLGFFNALNLNSSSISFLDAFRIFSPISIEYVGSTFLILIIGIISGLFRKNNYITKWEKWSYITFVIIAWIIIISPFWALDDKNSINDLYHFSLFLVLGVSSLAIGRLYFIQFNTKYKVTLFVILFFINYSSLKDYTYLFGMEKGLKLTIYESDIPNSVGAINTYPIVKIISNENLHMSTIPTVIENKYIYQSTDSSFIRLLFEVENKTYIIEKFENNKNVISIQNNLINQIIYFNNK